MKSTTRMFAAAVAFSSCAAAALAVTPASAMPSVKQGVTLESPLVQQAGYQWNKWKKKRHQLPLRQEGALASRPQGREVREGLQVMSRCVPAPALRRGGAASFPVSSASARPQSQRP